MNRRETPHTFAGNPIDRGDVLRRDEAEITELMRSNNARILVMAGLDPLISSNGDASASLGWVAYKSAVDMLGGEADLCTFLGIDGDGEPLVAWNTKGSARQGSEQIAGDKMSSLGLELCDARESAMLISAAETGILAQARANLGWHATHSFCARCGRTDCDASRRPHASVHSLQCATFSPYRSGRHNRRHQWRKMPPRTVGRAPQRDEDVLRSRGLYGPWGIDGRSRTRREVMEEAGIKVGRVQYHSTQPWPFPSSLMIGSHSEAVSTDINIDDFEMTDVRWWEREEVRLALAEKSELLRVPGPIAIAHHLIKAWATGQAGNFRIS